MRFLRDTLIAVWFIHSCAWSTDRLTVELLEAAQAGDNARVQNLLDVGAKVNAKGALSRNSWSRRIDGHSEKCAQVG